MSTIRILFMGTPEFARAHLQTLLDDSHFEVVGVVTQPDRPAGRKMQLQPSPVKSLALEKGLPVFTPTKVSKTETVAKSEAVGMSSREPLLYDAIKALKAEAVVVVAFGQILPQSFLDIFPRKVVNVHASLLPKWRGAAPIQRAIMAGDATSGVCLQVMVKKLDAGDIIGRYSLPIDNQINSLELHDQMIPLGKKLLHIDFMDYLRGQISPRPQNESETTYAHKIDKKESEIDWHQSAQQIHNLVRAMVWGPGTYSILDGKKLKISKTEVANPHQSARDRVGSIRITAQNEIEVQCGEGLLILKEVQPESKPKMKTADFLRGHALPSGAVFALKCGSGAD